MLKKQCDPWKQNEKYSDFSSEIIQAKDNKIIMICLKNKMSISNLISNRKHISKTKRK